MARTYKYYWQGNRMIVREYEGGSFQHEYHGYMVDNGYSVDIYPIKGQRSYGEVPYVGRRIPAHLMERIEPPSHPLRGRKSSQSELCPRGGANQPEEDEYDPTAWHLPGGEQETGAQIALLKGVI